jgi:hypothetical protein
MRKSSGCLVLQTILFAVIAFIGVRPGIASQDYQQTPIILNAKDVLPKTLLKGENYQVEDEVKNDGLINTYQLSTDYGPLTVESTAELMIRVTELKALWAMEELDRKGVFGDAVVEGVKAPVKGAVAMVKSPVETTKGIVKGTGQFLTNVGRAFVSDDPDQDNALKVALGYDVAKRQFAYEFGIDPYSDYDPAMDRLGEVARAAVAGGLAPKAALGAIDHDLATAMRISGTAQGMRKLVRDNPPGELRKINEKKLLQMGLDPSLAEAFLDNHRYNPQEETLLVGELESMKEVKGRNVFVSKANVAANKSVALFNRLSAQMMAGYHANVAPAIRIQNISGALSLQRKDGVLVFLGPIDQISWTKEVERRLKQIDNGIKKIPGVSGKEMWITGKFDEAARKQFEAKGWKVEENANDRLIKK